MLAEKDPIAVELFTKYKNVPMPNLRLNDGEIATVLAYLEAQKVTLQTTERHKAVPAQ